MEPYIKTVGDIQGTNTLRFGRKASGLSMALHLLETHIAGAPVVDDQGKMVGFVSEFDLLEAAEAGTNLNAVTAEDIMAKELHSVKASTSVKDAVKEMDQKHLLSLPVIGADGTVAKTVTRHDLLRATLGVGLSIESH